MRTALVWTAGVAILEGAFLAKWYHIGLHHVLHPLELALNYAIAALLATILLASGLRALRYLTGFRRTGRGLPGRRRGSPGRPSDRGITCIVGPLVAGGGAGVVTAHVLASRVLATAGSAGIVMGLIVGAIVALGVTVGLLLLGPRPRLVVDLMVLVATVVGIVRPGGLGAASPAMSPPADAPSVLLLVIDTVRADRLGLHGGPRDTTPTVDSLAAAGVHFTRAYAASSWTLPSTASIHTGLFPSGHGATTYESAVAPSAPRLATEFARAGYATAAFTENRFVTPQYGFGPGFETFWAYWFPWVHEHTLLHRVTRRLSLPTLSLVEKQEYPESPQGPGDLNWDARVTAGHAARWIARQERPFFAYVHFMGPHGPYGPPEHLLADPAPARPLANHPPEKGAGYPLGPRGAEVSDDVLADILLHYDADIRYVDAAISDLLSTLRDAAHADHTVVVVTGDHGEEFYDHAGWNHGATCFEEMVRTPLVVAGPGIGPAGTAVTTPVRHVDIRPTLLDLVGVPSGADEREAPTPVPGRSLFPALTGSPEGLGPRPVLVEGAVHRPQDGTVDAVIHERWKLIRVRVGAEERLLLHDLDEDPDETRSLDEAEPARRDTLLRDLLLWKELAAAPGSERAGIRLDPGLLETLRNLGYVN
jgi:arylsulfatase A-like enzyme